MSGEALFLANLDLIDRVAATVCRRHGVSAEDAADFAASVRLKMVESDYATFGKFRGDSSLSTYLTVVITRWFIDGRNARLGKWRPSAAALRGGPAAVVLERYVARQGCSVDEAIARILASGDHSVSERELRAMAASLPQRMPMRPQLVSDEAAIEVADTSAADSSLVRDELEEAGRHTAKALGAALADMPAEDRVILSMRYLDGRTVAEVARALDLEQKPLYRRIERSLLDLRARLEAQGVSSGSVNDMLTERSS